MLVNVKKVGACKKLLSNNVGECKKVKENVGTYKKCWSWSRNVGDS